MKYYKLTISYNGKNYSGWQIQKNANTIQEEMMNAGHKFMKDEFTITGASRTDSGVHALGQVAVLATNTVLETGRIPLAFNAHLPKDIVVWKIEEVNEDFHPRYQNVRKKYRYKIYNNAYPIPQYLHYALYYYKPLDIEKMKEGIMYLIGTHDFLGFTSSKNTLEDTVRTIYDAKIDVKEQEISIEVEGDGFLYNMVRIIAGTLLDIGCNRKKPEVIQQMIKEKDRSLGGKTAPAHGLTLVSIDYTVDKL